LTFPDITRFVEQNVSQWVFIGKDFQTN